MLTVDFDRLTLRPGDRVLDLGCGSGRHAFAAYRHGARVVALDRSEEGLEDVAAFLGAMATDGQASDAATAVVLQGDGLRLPFADASFDVVIAAEIFEHLPDDTSVMDEVNRVLKGGGRLAVSVPRWFPEVVCWVLSRAYHEVDGGHIRIYRRRKLLARLREAGFKSVDCHHAHGLHSPYWWLKCLLGPHRDDLRSVAAYHRLLVWDMTERPLITRTAERLLDPVIGKSLVCYLRKPAGTAARAGRAPEDAHAIA